MRLVYSAMFVSLVGGCFADGSVGVRANVVAPPPPTVYVEPAPARPPQPVYVEPAPPPQPEYAVDEEQPDLVEVSPGVQVIYDYDEPIFFSDGFYWHQTGGIWYSSRSYRGGWVSYSGTPVRFGGGFNVNAYAHYRPAGYVARHPGVNATIRVDGRSGPGPVRVDGRSGPGPVRNEPGRVVEPGGGVRTEVNGGVRTEPARTEVNGRVEVNGGARVNDGDHGATMHPAVQQAHPAPAKPTKTPPKKNTH